MTDEDALLAAVFERPWDETPKLVLADWYDDQGTPEAALRARYIRGCPPLLHKREKWGRWGWRHQKPDTPEPHAIPWLGMPAEFHPLAMKALPPYVKTRLTAYTIRRGFVHTVETWPVDFMGRPCTECYGGSFRSAPECTACNGQGNYPGGCVGRLFHAQPVCVVIFNGREPQREWGDARRTPIDSGYRWRRGLPDSGDEHDSRSRSYLPAPIFDRLTCRVPGPHTLLEYPTRRAAIEAASEAACAYGREKAKEFSLTLARRSRRIGFR